MRRFKPQNDLKYWDTSQNYKSDQIIMHCIDFYVKTIKTFELGRKTTKVIKLQWIASIWHQNNLKCGDTSQNYKSDQIIMNCIDLTSKRSKTFELGRKTTKVVKLLWIASIWHQNNLKCGDTSQNYKSDRITMNCIDLMSKRSKQRKTKKVIKL